MDLGLVASTYFDFKRNFKLSLILKPKRDRNKESFKLKIKVTVQDPALRSTELIGRIKIYKTFDY